METILIIDDEAPQRRLMASTLSAAGFQIVEAVDGLEGLSQAISNLPDLIVSDVNMPGLDGFELLKRLQREARTAAIPLILMTGAPEANGMRHSMEQGADDYLPKPFSGATLLAAVQTRLARKRSSQRSLREKQARLLDIIAATPTFVAIIESKSGTLIHLNPAAKAMLEINSEGATPNLALDSCFRLNDGSRPVSDFLEVAREQKRWIGECELIRLNGRRVPVELQLLAHSVNDSETWFSALARDLTDTVQLRNAQKMEAIGRLAAGIAHEINTPIQYVGDNTDFLKTSFQNLQPLLDDYREVLRAANENRLTPDLIQRAKRAIEESDLDYLLAQIPAATSETLEGINRISQIVRAMKEFSHPGQNELLPSDLNKGIESTVTVARNEWKYVADLALDLDATLPLVPCMIGEVNQAVLNLVVNAAHAISEASKSQPDGKGKIWIRTRRVDEWAEIRVTDTGAGIAPAAQPRIFEPFFTTKEVGRGTGQGLSMVYTCIVTRHGGTASFETEVGKGTTFILRLPLKPGSTGETELAKGTRP